MHTRLQTGTDRENKAPRLIDQLCNEIRLRHYSLRTEAAALIVTVFKGLAAWRG